MVRWLGTRSGPQKRSFPARPFRLRSSDASITPVVASSHLFLAPTARSIRGGRKPPGKDFGLSDNSLTNGGCVKHEAPCCEMVRGWGRNNSLPRGKGARAIRPEPSTRGVQRVSTLWRRTGPARGLAGVDGGWPKVVRQGSQRPREEEGGCRAAKSCRCEGRAPFSKKLKF